jgi:hypothetical protein
LTYIQFDVSNIQTKNPLITIENIKEDGGFALYGSNEQANMGTLLYRSSDSPKIQSTPLPNIKQYRYISVTASGQNITSNVLFKSIEINI